jgi:hypothetical protein
MSRRPTLVASLLTAGALLASAVPALAADKAPAAKHTALRLKVEPGDTEVWIDGKKKGTAEKLKEIPMDPGTHIVKLTHKGDEREDQVILKRNVVTTFEWKFEDDRPKPPEESGAEQMDMNK